MIDSISTAALFFVAFVAMGFLEEVVRRARQRKQREIEAMGDGPDFEAMDKAGVPVQVEAALPEEKPEE